MKESGKDGVWKSHGGQAQSHLTQGKSPAGEMCSHLSGLFPQPFPVYHLGAS